MNGDDISPSGLAASPPRWSTRLAAAVVVCATAGAYASSIDNYFAQDDFGVVWLLSQKTLTNIPGWFVSTWMDNIWGYTPDEVRPFPAITYMAASWFGAGSPVANHLLNIALHAWSAWLVLAIARTAGIGIVGATVGALVFVVLPNQAETVAWVTGRVDGMPAILYLGSVLAYARWRAHGRPRTFVLALVLCFVGLLSKQNLITLGPALVLYDLVVRRQPIRISWPWVRPYVPFAVLTAGYMALRYVLFDQVIREQMLTTEGLEFSRWMVGQHLLRIVVGTTELSSRWPPWAAASIALLCLAALALRRSSRTAPHAALRVLLYFGVLWTAVNLAPTLVAGYVSPRHAYLASAGWALAVAQLVDVLWRPAVRPRRAVAVAAVTGLLAVYSLQLRDAIVEWERHCAVSAHAVADVEREALAAPPGTLIVAGAPRLSWAWALPFATRPPFTSTDLGARVTVVGTAALHCCGTAQWEPHTRKLLAEWQRRSVPAPVVALYWDRRTGALSRVSDADDPYLRVLVGQLLNTTSADALDTNITRMLGEFVALHARVP